MLTDLDKYKEDVTPLVEALFKHLYNACVEQRIFCEEEFRKEKLGTDHAARLHKGAMDAEIALLYIYAVDTEAYVAANSAP